MAVHKPQTHSAIYRLRLVSSEIQMATLRFRGQERDGTNITDRRPGDVLTNQRRPPLPGSRCKSV